MLHDATGYPITKALNKVAKFYDVVINEFIRNNLYADDDMDSLRRYRFAKKSISDILGRFEANTKPYKLFKTIMELNPLFFDIEVGTNISKKISLVQVTSSFKKAIDDALTNSIVVTNALLGDYMEDGSLCVKHEKVYIDADSLRSARSGFKKKRAVKVANYLLCLNDVFGYLPHIPNESNFGRLYYRCINLQGAPKELRKAALPNAIEVDIDSCSNEFLMQQANRHGVGCDYLKLFSLEKTNIRVEITKKVFDVDESDANFYCDFGTECECDNKCDCKPVTNSYLKIIKQCITSIGFGARIIDYKDNAICNLLQNKIHRARFLNHEFITGYSSDMKKITTAVVKAHPELHDLPYLHSNSGKLSPSKLMAHQFQHFERYAMDTAFAGFDEYVKLRIHDGRYIEGMSPDDLNVVKRRFADMKLTVSVE
jgi:hypothetical protein